MQTPNSIMNRAESYQGLRKRAEQEKPRGPETLPADHPVWDVWQAVKSTYPGGTINWDAEPSIEWAYALEGLSPEQIATGVKTMVQDGGAFPPSAPSFREMCGPEGWEHYAQSRTCQEALNAPIIDRGEGALALPSPEGEKVGYGDFSSLMAGL